jgi:hypothetical protein
MRPAPPGRGLPSIQAARPTAVRMRAVHGKRKNKAPRSWRSGPQGERIVPFRADAPQASASLRHSGARCILIPAFVTCQLAAAFHHERPIRCIDSPRSAPRARCLPTLKCGRRWTGSPVGGATDRKSKDRAAGDVERQMARPDLRWINSVQYWVAMSATRGTKLLLVWHGSALTSADEKVVKQQRHASNGGWFGYDGAVGR